MLSLILLLTSSSQSTASFSVDVGLLTVHGLYRKDEACTLGQSCSSSNFGVGLVDGDRMMLCTDIGVVEYDLVAQEVRDTWKLEAGGVALSVRSVARSGDLWWAATSSGLWTAPVGSPFPGNPVTWSPAGLDGANLMDLLSLESGGLVALERREGTDAV